MKAAIKKALGVAETPANLEAEIRRLNAIGVALADEIAHAEQVAQTAEDEKVLLSAMAKAQAARNRQQRLDREIAELRRRLLIARNDARTRQVEQLRGAYRQAATAFLADARRALGSSAKVIEVRETMMAAGFTAECQTLPPMPMIGPAPLLGADLLDIFAAELTRTFEPQTVAPQRSRSVPPALASVPRAVPQRAEAPAQTARAAEPLEAAPLRPLHAEEQRPGERLVYFIRQGVPLPRELGLSRPMDVVSVDLETASQLLHNGAADFYTPPTENEVALETESAQPQPKETETALEPSTAGAA